ncbi:MAG: PD40 domain-containing protein [Bacteroidales bacterium]|nr:PD40 domain-containing protein [Bacteroidales bacterium]
MRKLLVIWLLAWVVTGAAQPPKKALKAYEQARAAFAERDYSKALGHVHKALTAAPAFAEAWLLQGEIGMETRDYRLAQEGYERSLEADSMLFPPAALTLAGLYDRQQRYADEIGLLEWFQRTAPGNQANDEKATKMLRNARFRKDAVAHPVAFQPESLGAGVNTPNDEYVNALELTGTELLFTRRFSAEGAAFQQEGLFSSRAVEGQWYAPAPIELDPELDDHMGAAFLSQKGNELFFTVCGLDLKTRSCDLYCATRERREGPWEHPQPLNVNGPNWESQPCLSLDGKELFFASRRGGDADLYHCFRDAEGYWSEPESLGSVINTPGTEMAPFLHPDGKTLYFSSDTHMGMGGYDLFVSRRNENGAWSEPVNLGYPINTPGDEINFIVAADGHTALISSIREGGAGGYDIYRFQLQDDDLKPEAVNVYDYLVDDLKPGTVVQLVNIQFEFNSAALTADSEEGVAMLAAFLEQHPDLEVELSGHTDNVGSDAYNQQLSEQRAEVVRQALIEKGIAAARLSAKGYGATRPVGPNDTEAQRALNRRTEMTILQETKTKP